MINVAQENGMQVAAEGDENNTEWVDNAYTNNEYVELKNPYSDEFQGDDWVDITVMENITACLWWFESWWYIWNEDKIATSN